MKIDTQVKKALSSKFNRQRINSLIKHYSYASMEFRKGEDENSLAKGGKFFEAAIKMLWIHAGENLPIPIRTFKTSIYADKIIRLSSTKLANDSLKLLIPRAVIYGYGITSNRGGRHDTEDVYPNKMDASIVMSLMSWIVAELIRISSNGLKSPDQALILAEALLEKKYPFFDKIDNNLYIDMNYSSALECGILLLYGVYPVRMKRTKLKDLLKIHGYKKTAYKLERLKPFVDLNENDEYLLRASGQRKAENIINSSTKINTTSN